MVSINIIIKFIVKTTEKTSVEKKLREQKQENPKLLSSSSAGPAQTKKTVKMSKVVENPLGDLFD